MKKFLILFMCVAIFGCAGSSGPKLVDGKPEWYFSPTKDGKAGGVGVSGMHKDGKSGQKQLAMERALSQIARQMGVQVDTFSNLKSVSTNSGTSVSGQSSSFFTTSGVQVKAHVEEMWEDPYTKELYIWMVSE